MIRRVVGVCRDLRRANNILVIIVLVILNEWTNG